MHEHLPAIMARLDHVARRVELLRAGLHQKNLRRAVESGALIRVRNGTYADALAPREVVRASRVGGVLAGASAAALHGLWTPHEFVLTVSVFPNAQRLRDPDDANRPLADAAVVVLRDAHHLTTDERLVASPATVAVQAVRHGDPRTALATIDSALRLPPGERPQLAEIAARLPRRLRYLVGWADPRAESGTESALRYELRKAGLRFECQVWLTSTIRVDFVVEGSLVVECTSKEHHGSPEQDNKDRARITTIIGLGYVVMEFTYQQVFFDLPRVWQALVQGLLLRHSALPHVQAPLQIRE